jgi:hypothetical protein
MIRILLGGVAALALGASAQAAVLYQNDFDGNVALGAGVTGGFSGETTLSTATTGAWNAAGWAGNHINNSTQGNPAAFTTLSLSNLATHTSVSMSFIVGLLDSWDSYESGPDNLEIWIDGVQVANMTTNTALCCTEDYDGGTELYEGIQADNHSGYYSDVLVDMSSAGFMTFGHTASTLTLGIRASGAGWQGSTDEAWGIDNIAISYDGGGVDPGPGVPEPATWAMMIMGFGFAGAAMRRRKALLT